MTKNICEFCADCYRYDDDECEGSEEFPENCFMTSKDTVFEYMDNYECVEIFSEILYDHPESILELPEVFKIIQTHYHNKIKDIWYERFMARYK